jgi:hypothetical protein
VLASPAAWIAERRAASRTDNAARSPAALGWGELVAAQRLAGGPGGVQWVGLGGVAAGGPLGPVQLHNLFLVAMKEPGQAGR